MESDGMADGTGRDGASTPAARVFLKLAGKDGKPIAGSATSADRAGWLEIQGWSHRITSPRDAASGLPTGRRRHEPLVVSKPIDRSSPRLMGALLDNEVLSQWRLEIWRPIPPRARRKPAVSDLLDLPRDEALGIFEQRLEASRKRQTCWHAIELTGATVSGIETEMVDTSDLDNIYQEPGELVSFTYEQIEWIWMLDEGAVSVESRWENEDSTVGAPVTPTGKETGRAEDAGTNMPGSRAVRFECSGLEWKKKKAGSVSALVRVVDGDGNGIAGAGLSWQFTNPETGATPRSEPSPTSTDPDGMARIEQTGFAVSSKKGFHFHLVGATRDGRDLLGARRPGWEWSPGNRCTPLA